MRILSTLGQKGKEIRTVHSSQYVEDVWLNPTVLTPGNYLSTDILKKDNWFFNKILAINKAKLFF